MSVPDESGEREPEESDKEDRGRKLKSSARQKPEMIMIEIKANIPLGTGRRRNYRRNNQRPPVRRMIASFPAAPS